MRKIRVVGEIAYVPLTKGYEAVVDAADLPLIANFSWRALVKPNTVYAVCKDRNGPRPRMVLMHRRISGAAEAVEIDHRDKNGLNNRRSNLRDATHEQNSYNRKTHRHNSSGFKGVSRSGRKWRADIRAAGESRYLGTYDTPESAASAYAQASRTLHGEFGSTK